jgi:hypothetical protein
MSFDYEASFVLGGKYAELVAKRLRSDGIGCYAPPIKLARNNEERDYMTKYETDIVLTKLKDYLEVKSSSRFYSVSKEMLQPYSLLVGSLQKLQRRVQGDTDSD